MYLGANDRDKAIGIELLTFSVCLQEESSH